jgi:hypothetical protein
MPTNLKAAWECGDCGKVEYGEYPPEECNKCWKSNSFAEVPEDKVEALKDTVLDDIRSEDFDDDEEEEEDEHA